MGWKKWQHLQVEGEGQEGQEGSQVEGCVGHWGGETCM